MKRCLDSRIFCLLSNTNSKINRWVYRCFVEGLCGLRGDKDGLRINPQLPSAWNGIKVTRLFRGAKFVLDIRHQNIEKVTVKLDGQALSEAHIKDVEAGKTYLLSVAVPR